VFLYLSMRKQFRKINIPRQGAADEQTPAKEEPPAGTSTE
jgi:hypothetical protein